MQSYLKKNSKLHKNKDHGLKIEITPTRTRVNSSQDRTIQAAQDKGFKQGTQLRQGTRQGTRHKQGTSKEQARHQSGVFLLSVLRVTSASFACLALDTMVESCPVLSAALSLSRMYSGWMRCCVGDQKASLFLSLTLSLTLSLSHSHLQAVL